MQNGNKSGFTLIELLVVLSIIALLITIVSPRYFNKIDRAKLEVREQQLITLRKVIDEYHADTNNYPSSLEALVKNGYIRHVPLDPLTEKNDTWILIYEKSNPNKVGIIDVSAPDPQKILR